MKYCIRLLSLIITLLLFSCSKEFDSALNSDKYALQQTFITDDEFLSESFARNINSFICKHSDDTSNSVAIYQIKRQLQELENNNPESLKRYSNIFGYPVWDANISGIDSNGDEWYLIPSIAEEQDSTYAILVAHRYPNDIYDIHFYKRYDINLHLRKNRPSSIKIIKDIYDLFSICDCNIFCRVADKSKSISDSSTIDSKYKTITITWVTPKDYEDNCESIPQTITKLFLGNNSDGGVKSNGRARIFWGAGTGTGGGSPVRRK